MSLRLATGPVCWGVDFTDAPANPPWPEVLDGIAGAGLEWMELGPLGYLPADAGPELERRGLRVCGGFVFEPLHDPAERERVLAVGARTAARVAALGGRYLVLIDAVCPERSATAGRSDAARRLAPRALDALRGTLAALVALAAERGLHALVHNHAGTHIEFRDEIEAVLDVADLCLDTGHCAYAGLDPVALYSELADRIPYLHLKDVDPARRRGDFWASVGAGAFRPLGSGVVDFAGLLAELGAHGFDGWGVIEQDRVPGGRPMADLVRSRRHLREAERCRG
jgi:inosose dehydratase